MSKPFQVYEKCLQAGKFKLAYRIMNKHFEVFPLYESAPSIRELYQAISERTVLRNQKQ